MLRTTTIALALLAAAALPGCDFDPAAPEYDEQRYNALLKANCDEISSVGASKLISKEGKDKDEILNRCEKMKSLTLEQYKYAADYARKNGGVWDLDNIPK